MAEATGEAAHLVTIIGAGFGGLCMAIKLKEAGIHDFVILEKADEVGGTWYVNSYPGAACDIPSHLYSYSFAPWPHWSRTFATQPEIQQYILHCVEKYALRQHIRFGTQATESRFDNESNKWTVHTSDGSSYTSRFLVAATGGLSIPAIPDLPGLETFAGPRFHSAEWDHAIDLKDKNVAVIGTGASAIQFVPQIVKTVGALKLFQRTAPWVLPRPDRAYTNFEKWLFAHVPLAAKWLRAAIYWQHEAQGLGFVKYPGLLRVAERMGLRNINKGIKDKGLRDVVKPSYHVGCKRILMANDYYPALARPNVEVVTTNISRVVLNGIITSDGATHPVDVIIYGTGFRIADYLWPLKMYGSAGQEIREVWGQAPSAYLGISVHGFPNMFLIVGPNTGLGHNSMIIMIEAQVQHIMDTLRHMAQHNFTCIEALAETMKLYSDEMQRGLQGTVWLTGCSSWYLTPQGDNFTLWPGLTWAYRQRTKGFHADAYAVG